MTVIEGEVVDPGKVVICEPGKAASARALMDRRGEFGGVVRESETCPRGQVVAIDTDRIQADLDAALGAEPRMPFGLTDPARGFDRMRMAYMFGGTLAPISPLRVTGC